MAPFSFPFGKFWNTQFFKEVSLVKNVAQVCLVAYKNENNLGGPTGLPPTNHWCTFLVHPEEMGNVQSVLLDMSPGFGKQVCKGQLNIESKPYAFTNQGIQYFTFDAVPGVTVQHVVALLQANGRHDYTFDPAMEGCAYWNLVVFQDLEAAGILPPGSAQSAYEALACYWVNPSGQVPREMVRGRF